jgi:large subunit ribosomal protein L24e
MPKCSLCGNELEKGSGMMFVTKDGSINHFCSGKCEKNARNLGRKGKNLKWTARYKKGTQG